MCLVCFNRLWSGAFQSNQAAKRWTLHISLSNPINYSSIDYTIVWHSIMTISCRRWYWSRRILITIIPVAAFRAAFGSLYALKPNTPPAASYFEERKNCYANINGNFNYVFGHPSPNCWWPVGVANFTVRRQVRGVNYRWLKLKPQT